MYDFFISCPKGLEELLADEVAQFGFTVKLKLGGVAAQIDEGRFYQIYAFCLHSRLANRVVWVLSEFTVSDKDSMYRQLYQLPWMQFFNADKTIAVALRGTNRFISNSHYGAMLVKDAVVDHFNQYTGSRPSVDAKQPDVAIYCHLNKKQLLVGLDISGGSLHRRGYRLQGAKAPLKENLAAALVSRARQFSAEGQWVDPFCGSATLLVEGLLLDLNIAANVDRKHFGFEHLKKHNQQVFLEMQRAASQQRDAAISAAGDALQQDQFLAYGFDADENAVLAARDNIRRAGLTKLISIQQRSILSFKRPSVEKALLVMNPPYGERLSERDKLLSLYANIGEQLKSQCQGDHAAILSSDPFLLKNLGLQKKKRYKFYNGKLESEWLLFQLFKKSQPIEADHDLAESKQASEKPKPWASKPASAQEEKDQQAIDMVANRLRKNQKRLSKWAQQESISCYRIYDADMPEYAFALDVYDGRYQLTEYVAPKSVDEFAAYKRQRQFIKACLSVFGLEKEQLILKQRRQQKGQQQYQKINQRGHFFTVQEGDATFEVNLHDYLDTGLFLDHRPIRLSLAKQAAGKRVLNLFCYTATASVHAALGGADCSDSVDMSQTYLAWAERNYRLNNLDLKQHRLHRANVLDWISQNQQQYDLIFIDPPSFSNSKRMQGNWDVQRDHHGVLQQLMQHLAPAGEMIFSNNLRRFKLDARLAQEFKVSDISASTIDQDFKRNSHIHQCWRINHK